MHVVIAATFVYWYITVLAKAFTPEHGAWCESWRFWAGSIGLSGIVILYSLYLYSLGAAANERKHQKETDRH